MKTLTLCIEMNDIRNGKPAGKMIVLHKGLAMSEARSLVESHDTALQTGNCRIMVLTDSQTFPLAPRHVVSADAHSIPHFIGHNYAPASPIRA